MPWQRMSYGYRCTQGGCGYVTDGDPRDIARHRLAHLAEMLEGSALAPPAAVAEAEYIIRDDSERARKLWNPTIGGKP